MRAADRDLQGQDAAHWLGVPAETYWYKDIVMMARDKYSTKTTMCIRTLPHQGVCFLEGRGRSGSSPRRR